MTCRSWVPVVALFAGLAICPSTRAQPGDESQVLRLEQQVRQLQTDWANLGRYRAANAAIPPPAPGQHRVVFVGDSITDFWINARPAFFNSHPFLDRGISGQTTPQILIRFRPDVIDPHPSVVVILAGTNDIAGNTGPESLQEIEGNLESMAELAHASQIRVVLSSVLPVYAYPWKPGLQPAPEIVALNKWIKDYCAQHHAVYLDYYAAMVDDRGGMRADLSQDGVHPNAAGYAIMEPLAERAIRKALR